ncbi:MAG TPA: hypothetical protein VL832_29490 [Puia sp.]|nr:hypothetical protein [Puia sp.]
MGKQWENRILSHAPLQKKLTYQQVSASVPKIHPPAVLVAFSFALNSDIRSAQKPSRAGTPA